MDMARTNATSRAWRFARGFSVVRCAPPVRQRRRIHCLGALLFLPGHAASVCLVERRARDRRGLGSVWRDFYGDRGRAHTLRASRGGVVELAAHFIAWPLARPRRGITVLLDYRCAVGTVP